MKRLIYTRRLQNASMRFRIVEMYAEDAFTLILSH